MFNLLPQYQRAKLEKEYRLRIIVVVLAFACAFFVISAISLIPTYIISQGVIEDIESQVEAYKARAASAGNTPASTALKQVKDLTTALQSDGRQSVSEVFSDIITARPDGVKLYGLSLNNGENRAVQLNGMASTRQSLVDFKKNLEKLSAVKAVDLPISMLTKSTDLEFSIAVTLN